MTTPFYLRPNVQSTTIMLAWLANPRVSPVSPIEEEDAAERSLISQPLAGNAERPRLFVCAEFFAAGFRQQNCAQDHDQVGAGGKNGDGLSQWEAATDVSDQRGE